VWLVHRDGLSSVGPSRHRCNPHHAARARRAPLRGDWRPGV